MKKLSQLLGLAFLVSFWTGCYSLETSPLGAVKGSSFSVHNAGGVPSEHVVVANSGWYLFNAWPLATGNAGRNARFPWHFFRNDVDANLLQGNLTRYAQLKGCQLEEVNVFYDKQLLLSLPGFEIPIPFILTYREMQFSGVLTRKDAAREKAKRLRRETNNLLNTLPDGGAQ